MNTEKQLLYFMADKCKIEALDDKTSIITVECPTSLANDILELTDYLAHASRWLKIRGAASRASLRAKGAL